MKKLQDVRREYGQRELNEEKISHDPFVLFEQWMQDALASGEKDPTAMVLATVDKDGIPDTRMVLLKDFASSGFIFYTQYNSPKAIQAESNKKVALNFYWMELARQVRVRGSVERTTRQESEDFFQSRPRESQISTVASKQSTVISSRKELEDHVKAIHQQYEGKSIPCPKDWGAYRVIPFEFEFFQGRDSRLSDRIHFIKHHNQWKMERLSP